jgi:c-di-GMP-binding flagellar brake protein YcgR
VEAVVSQQSSPADRRARARISVAIEIKLHAPEHHYMLMSRTIDLSSHGAFVRTNRPLPIGAPVTVSFNRGNDRNPLMLDAEVVRSGTADGGRQRGIAVRFKDLSDLDEMLLNELIERTQA